MTESGREAILSVLAGDRRGWAPCFSGLICVSAEALDFPFSEAHFDAAKMAAAAASTVQKAGWSSASLPLDLCVIAEALGAGIDFGADQKVPSFPVTARPVDSRLRLIETDRVEGILQHERLPVVLEAIRGLKAEIGGEAVIGAWIPGPMTLALYAFDLQVVLNSIIHKDPLLPDLMRQFTDILIRVGAAYQEAGADFITIHEMGGSPSFVGRRGFETLILPQLSMLTKALRPPLVLSMCGNTNSVMTLMADLSVAGFSVDQTNDLAASRQVIGSSKLLLGNIDPAGVLDQGGDEDIDRAVESALRNGADAIWPGCDVPPTISLHNLQRMAAVTADYNQK